MNRGQLPGLERMPDLRDPHQRPSALVRQLFGKRPGFWYSDADRATSAVNGGTTILNLSRFAFPEPGVIEQFGIECTTLLSGGTVRLGAYGSDADGLPIDLLGDFGTVGYDTTGFKTVLSMLDVWGAVWLAAVPSSGSGAFRSVESPPSESAGSSSQADLTSGISLQYTVTGASPPNPLPTVLDVRLLRAGAGHMRFTLKMAP